MAKSSTGVLVLALVTLVFICQVRAQQACDSEAFRQFDFWLGTWQVKTEQGGVVGSNRIAKAHNDCVVTEYYRATSGFSGQSVNLYHAPTNQWHQTWVDSSGTLLQLWGGLDGNAMKLEGKTSDSQGKTAIHRITWTPLAGGDVRQHWQMKSADSLTWTTVFDGRYTKSK